MSREYQFILIAIVALLFSVTYWLYKKSGLFEIRPDEIISYREIDGDKLSLHLFRPKAKKKTDKTPVILFFHGGAWQFGEPRQFYKQCQYFTGLGLTCISAQYRIESLHGTDPRASISDSRVAFRYIKEHSHRLNIDAEKIIVAGGSAGGHLAATLGVALPLPMDESDSLSEIRPNALILYNPMIDLSPGKPDYQLVADFWYQVSPLQHIDANTPPSLILLGTDDSEVPVSTATNFCERVKAEGVLCELALYKGAKHGFFNYRAGNSQYFDETNQRIKLFLTQQGFMESSH